MSMRFWVSSGVMLTGAIAIGLAVGGFATRSPLQASADPSWSIGANASDSPTNVAPVSTPPDHAPGTVRCSGCGPTLAERRMAADNAGFDPDGMIHGSSDPVVTDYLAQAEKDARPVPLVVPPPSPAHRLPANIQRFADGAPIAPVVAPPVAARTIDPVSLPQP